jgi:pilus assembly protein TadC
MPNPFAQPLDRLVASFTLILVLLGFLLAWRWESLGGIISLLGWVLFVTAESVLFRDTLFFIVLGVPSFLFLASSFLRHYEKHKSA